MTNRPTTAANTAPKEKNTDNAVTRYCLPLGMCSKRSVPSVGIEPYTSDELLRSENGEYTYPNGAPQAEQRETQPTESAGEGRKDAKHGRKEERGIEGRGTAHEIGALQ